MVAGQIHPGPGDQRRQPGHEIQRLQQHMRGAVAVRRLELVTYPDGYGVSDTYVDSVINESCDTNERESLASTPNNDCDDSDAGVYPGA